MKNVVLLKVTIKQGSVIYIGDNVESLRNKLIVNAYFDDNTIKVISEYIITDITGGDVISTDKKVIIEYRDFTTTYAISSATVNPSGILYDWDFTKSLIDNRKGAKATLICSSYYDAVPIFPRFDTSGITFSAAGQGVSLIPPSVNISENFFNTTIEIDVSSYHDWINTLDEARLLSFANRKSDDTYYSGIVHNANIGWRMLVDDGIGFGDVYTGMTARDSIIGHTIGLHITNNGNVKMYVDGVSKGVSSVALTSAYGGIMIGSVDSIVGANLYVFRITGARIYNGDKS